MKTLKEGDRAPGSLADNDAVAVGGPRMPRGHRQKAFWVGGKLSLSGKVYVNHPSLQTLSLVKVKREIEGHPPKLGSSAQSCRYRSVHLGRKSCRSLRGKGNRADRYSFNDAIHQSHRIQGGPESSPANPSMVRNLSQFWTIWNFVRFDVCEVYKGQGIARRADQNTLFSSVKTPNSSKESSTCLVRIINCLETSYLLWERLFSVHARGRV